MSRVLTPERFHHVSGTMEADAPSYVVRQADQELLDGIIAGDFCCILTPRQMGKSSLKVRAVAQLTKKHLRSVVIDLTGIIERGMTAEAFYAGLLHAFVQQLKLPVELVQWWQERAPMTAVQRFSDFVADEVLPRVRKRLVVFIDEIDATLNLDFSDDFFAAMRAFYNARSQNPAFKRLTCVFLGSASPSALIKDRTRTPFNVGRRIELTDFTFAEARKLAEGFPLDHKTAEQYLQRVLYWTGGHPYLTQNVCAVLATSELSSRHAHDVDMLIDTLFFSDATWSDPNLAHVRDRIVEDQEQPDALLTLYRRIRAGEQILDDERSPVHAALKLSGIVKVFPGGMLRPRNRIYERVFDLAWVDTVQRTRAPKQPPHEDSTGLGEGLRRTIADLQAKQRQLGLDFSAQIAELQRRLEAGIQVSQSGSGAVATEDGIASGARGVAIGGDVWGSTLMTGDHNVVANVYTGPPAHDPEDALAIYRRVLVASSRHMSLQGLDVSASDPTGKQQHFDLAHVYVDLHTTTYSVTDVSRYRRKRVRIEEGERKPLRALEAVVTHRRLVLLGDPGSGKSTFLNHLAVCLAAHGLDRCEDWHTRLSGWPSQESDVVPILITLRDFARWLPQGVKKAAPSHLWTFIMTRLEAQNLTFAAEPLHNRLERGQAILLLDGLDEIPTPQQRTFMRDTVSACATRYPQCRIIVTCRTLAYQEPAWQLADFENVTLAPFKPEQIEHFIAAWYAELARLGRIKPGAVEGVTRHLQEAVRRPDLWRLASNPLLLTVMALVHTHKGRLPEARALLYDETVDILLWRWEQIKISGEDDMPQLRYLLTQANRTDVDLKRALWHLAFEVHREGEAADAEGVADIGESRLYKTLVELHPDKSHDWAHQVVEVMKMRAGLLLERVSGVYTFPHRTFQEYLAGAHLSTQPDFAQQAAQLVTAGALWREVVLLAVGRLVYLNGDTAKPLALVAELCPLRHKNAQVVWRQVWLAGDVLLEVGQNRVRDSALGRELDARVRQRLVKLLRTDRLQPVERAAAGATLARLGDPRFQADAWYLPDEPLLGFVEIPAGAFVMGSDKTRDPMAYDDEIPQHRVTLARYYMARYPVTVAQFRAFVESSDHEPEDDDSLRGLPNHPVVWVSWYEALKYCDWLTERLRAWDGTPEPLATLLRAQGWRITLPSEAEWEKAARGTDQRLYPWGDEPDPHRANYDDTDINTTSAVGSFPKGASPYGVEDMSGNVWEWTRSLWGTDWRKPAFKYRYKPDDGREDMNASDEVLRVLRGGSFLLPRPTVRCAYRLGLSPSGRYTYVGFRVVLLP